MQTTRIPKLLILLAAGTLGACATTGQRGGAESTAGGSGPMLGIPEQTLDALPLEHLLAAEFALREDNLDSAAAAYLEAAQQSDQADIARRATRVNLSAQRWDDAAVALERWRELGGQSRPDFSQAELLLSLGRGESETAYSQIVQLIAEGGMPAARLAGGALEAAPDRGLAIRILERLVASGDLPADKATYIGLSQLALKMERNDLAERLAALASERLPDAAEVWFWRARLANAGGHADEARRILDQALATHPDDPEVRRTYAVLLRTELDDPRAAAASLADLPADDETLVLRGAYALEAGDWKQVIEVHDALSTLPQPHPVPRLLMLGGIAEALGEVAANATPPRQVEIVRWREKAVAWYSGVPEGAGNDYSRALLRLAVLDQEAGRIEASRQRLMSIRDRADPDSEAFADSFLLEAELLSRVGRDADALAALDAGLAALPDEQRMRYARGLTRERLDQVDGALDDFRALTELDPDNPVYLNAYGYTLSDRTDRQEEALVLIERAHHIDPEDIATLDSLGWVLFKLGRHEEALVHLQRAHAAQPEGEIAAHLGEALWTVGQKEEARRVWRAAIEQDPDNRALMNTIARLKPW